MAYRSARNPLQARQKLLWERNLPAGGGRGLWVQREGFRIGGKKVLKTGPQRETRIGTSARSPMLSRGRRVPLDRPHFFLRKREKETHHRGKGGLVGSSIEKKSVGGGTNEPLNSRHPGGGGASYAEAKRDNEEKKSAGVSGSNRSLRRLSI